MPRTSNRADKVSDLIKKELALLIQLEVRDPRIGMASVTGVKVSRDLAYANVYVTILGKSDSADIKEAITVLNKASGFLRSMLAKNISLRSTPRLKFIYDDSLIRGQYMSGLIDKAIAQDQQAHKDDDQGEVENN